MPDHAAPPSGDGERLTWRDGRTGRKRRARWATCSGVLRWARADRGLILARGGRGTESSGTRSRGAPAPSLERDVLVVEVAGRPVGTCAFPKHDVANCSRLGDGVSGISAYGVREAVAEGDGQDAKEDDDRDPEAQRPSLRRDEHHRSSRAWRPSASARPCTSATPAPAACTTWSTRSSTTRSTRRWPATATTIDVIDPRRRLGHASPTTAAASRSTCTPKIEAAGARGRDDHAARRRQVRRRRPTRCPAACTASASRSSTPCPSGSRSRSAATARSTTQRYERGKPDRGTR